MDSDSRLRAARGIGKVETEASLKAFQTMQQRGHLEALPPLISDGWCGIDDAMVAVYGLFPEYSGRGHRPLYPRPVKDWLYLQMVKQRGEYGRLQSICLKAVWGNQEELVELLGKSTAYIECSRGAATWEDAYYNWVRAHKSLRVVTPDDSPLKWTLRTPRMAASLTDHIWTDKKLLLTVPLPSAINIC